MCRATVIFAEATEIKVLLSSDSVFFRLFELNKLKLKYGRNDQKVSRFDHREMH